MINTNYFAKWAELDEKVRQNLNDSKITIFVKGDCNNNIFITNDKENHRSFMVEFNSKSLRGYKPIVINGIDIFIRDDANFDSTKKYLVFENLDGKMENAFIAFSVTIISNLKNCDTDSKTLFQIEQILKDYKDFFSFKKNIDKKDEQGLIAELDYLNRLIDKLSEKAVINWTGPEKNKHDFTFPDEAIEIKSTLNEEQSIVTISNENQLDIGKLKGLKLKLYVFNENSAGETVDFYINRIYKKLISFEVKKIFIAKICMYKINPLEYKGIYKFNIESIKSYQVDDNFPRINKSNIPSEIYDVKYKLNLSNLKYEKEY